MIYTVFLYVLPDNAAQHFVVTGDNATQAADAAIAKAGFRNKDCEIIAVLRGEAQFEAVEENRFNFFPFGTQNI